MKIILREFGGLGNQLFRYAALRYYAKRYGADMQISVDPAWNAMSFGFPRPCLFSHYSIPVPMSERSFADRFFLTEKPYLRGPSNIVKKALRTQVFTQPPRRRYAFTRDIPLDRHVETLYLVGFWHTRIIVEEVADELRSELTLKEPARGKNLEVLQQIRRSKTSISLHVRRGDCKIPATLRAELPIGYYLKAISTFKERFSDPTFFVFSDDIQFVKSYLPPGTSTIFVEHNNDFSAHEDLRLMSACHHHIIANSTFSWWGAWLNNRPDKVVIAPRNWDLTENSYYPDLLPASWMLSDVAMAS